MPHHDAAHHRDARADASPPLTSPRRRRRRLPRRWITAMPPDARPGRCSSTPALTPASPPLHHDAPPRPPRRRIIARITPPARARGAHPRRTTPTPARPPHAHHCSIARPPPLDFFPPTAYHARRSEQHRPGGPVDTAALDRDIDVLVKSKDLWVALPLSRRIEYLRGVLRGVEATADRLVEAAIAAKGIPPGSALVGEEYFGGPVVIARTIRLTLRTLEQIEKNGAPTLPKGAIRTRRDGQVAVQVFPTDTLDKLAFAGFKAEVWQEPGVTAADIPMASFYRDPKSHPGKVALVLAAGNVASIGPLDMVYKLFAEGQVVLCKFNPVNDYTGPFVEEMFAELIRDGFVRTAYGAGDVGAYLCEHPRSTRSTSPAATAPTTSSSSAPVKRARSARPRTSRATTSASPASSATSARSSSCPAPGPRASCASRPKTSRPCSPTTPASTATPPA
ncbi:MAG: hypothetical protein H6705_01875 [Myxococcales bacterium]|nr:hypothetical protein [Myxococcales bacterium]